MNKEHLDFYEFSRAVLVSKSGLELYPMQWAILQRLYTGSPMNEQLGKYGSSQDVALPFGSHLPVETPNELIWISGRRTGKTMMLSLMAAYEFYRLYSGPNPEPSLASRYINIICVTESSPSARIIWHEILPMIQALGLEVEINNSELTISRYTSWGKVTIKVASATSDSITGLSVYALFLDNLAHMKFPEKLLQTIIPTLSTYKNHKLVIATTPRPKITPLLKRITEPSEKRMVVYTPTWVVNPNYTEQQLRNETKLLDDIFLCEFGAAFSTDDPTEQVTIRLKQSVIEKLKKISRRRAFETDDDITYTDVIREILEMA